MKFFSLLLLALLGVATAFVPKAPLMQKTAVAPRARAMKMVEESTYWDGKAPDPKVLGPFLSKVPSGVLGPLSLVCLIAGSAAVHESNIFHTLTVDTINPAYVLASFLTPISWGLHVGAWIQKQNGN